MRELYLFLFFFLFLLSACKKFKPADEAFFIRASSVSVKTTPTQGSGSHKITDLFLYVNGQVQGSYPVGNLMPIVSKGKPVTINVQAGIKNNGIGETRLVWPFYKTIEVDTSVESGKTIDRSISFEYKTSTTFTFLESFDGAGIGIVNSAISESAYKIVDAGPESFEGRCIALELSSNQMISQIETSSSGFSLPKNTADVYLELNYKGNEQFVCGLVGSNGELKPTMVITPQPNWNKIYVQLSTTINSEPMSNLYKLYFRLLKLENSNPKIFLDNIKLVHF